MKSSDDNARRLGFLTQVKATHHGGHHHHAILTSFAAAAAFLYTLPFWMKLTEQIQSFSQAVADALVVAIVVSLAVEPRLLRYFGEELKSFGEDLGTQAFWSSFYARAPKIYIDAVKRLAEAEQFTVASNWIATFDWANDDRSILKLSVDHANYRENRSTREYPVVTKTFMYESPFDQHRSQFHRQAVICESVEFFGDLLKDGRAKMEASEGGTLRIRPSEGSATPYVAVPPGERFTVLTSAETYVPTRGYFPLMVNTPTLRLTIQLKGNALSDLSVLITPSNDPSIRGAGDDLARRGPIEVSGVFVTGQAVLLSWGRHLNPDN